MALTRNGKYRGIGKQLSSYRAGRFTHYLQDTLGAPAPCFETAEQVEPYDGLTYTTAKPVQALVRRLRLYMDQQEEGSVGCPVARHSILLDRTVTVTDPHVRRLLESGHLQEVPARSTDKTVRLTQEFSAIDRLLAFFAWQLDTYADRYGTPRTTNGIKFVHERVPRHNYLVRCPDQAGDA